VRRIRDEETARIVEIVQAHADYDERGNRVLVDLIVDEICGGSEVRADAAADALADALGAVSVAMDQGPALPLDPDRAL
jgi:hypothetical protein